MKLHQLIQRLAPNLAMAGAALCILLSLPVSGATTAAAVRENTLLSSGWLFKQGEVPGAEKTEFNAGGWQSVTIPHCWGWEQAQLGEDYYRGPGWYRRELAITPEKYKRYFLRFEAAGSVADVYLNGQFLGEHRGAFGAFCFEITTNLSATGTNLLAVRVSNAPGRHRAIERRFSRLWRAVSSGAFD